MSYSRSFAEIRLPFSSALASFSQFCITYSILEYAMSEVSFGPRSWFWFAFLLSRIPWWQFKNDKLYRPLNDVVCSQSRVDYVNVYLIDIIWYIQWLKYPTIRWYQMFWLICVGYYNFQFNRWANSRRSFVNCALGS